MMLLDELGLADYQAGHHFYETYASEQSGVDIASYNQFMQRPFVEHPLETLLEVRATFVETRIAPRASREMLSIVDEHIAAGHVTSIVTGSQRFVTEPVAEFFGIPHLLASDAEKRDGSYTGRPVDPPCFREGKCVHVERLLDSLGSSWESVTESWYYADSHHDVPLFERVRHPIAVGPNPTLEKIAIEAGWKILRPHD